MFALRHKKDGCLMGFSYSSNDGDFCTSVSFELEHPKYSDKIWVTTDRETAENVANSTSAWYNANYNSPENSFVGELEVVEIEIKI